MGENKRRMLAGDWFLPDDPELAADSVRRAELCSRYNAPDPPPEPRDAVLRELLGSVGDGVRIRPPFRCDFGYHIRIGAGTFVNFGAVFLDSAPVTVGADVQIGPHAQLLTPTHPLDPELRRAGWERGLPVTLGDNVWLGGGVIVCPGVTIGENTVVGAGSVVVKDLPPGVLAVGNPARVVRVLGPAESGPGRPDPGSAG
ncbi:sugar O-acetyltransferase [Streptomyces bambusae]|uniref:Sugar O-acetyltransferase n=1 Tax=Streptomyces bambusae TaxID=1550616 RepID=A0ABS6ZF06_9ACTN|nr:sugar O-acetyltransferase [Streptomyces bambusae]MBW5485301.1 sugar O-acetyltransferase [Streptomyces bambusae]